MKRLFLLVLLVCGFGSSQAQIYDPVSWEFSVENVKGDEATLVLSATIQDRWYVYSQFIEEGGPIPTSFSFEKSDVYSLIGSVSESPKAVAGFDSVFSMQIAKHKNKVDFKQRIKLKQAKVTVKGMLEFMTCDDRNCLPPEEVEFSIAVDASKTFGQAKQGSGNDSKASEPKEESPIAIPSASITSETTDTLSLLTVTTPSDSTDNLTINSSDSIVSDAEASGMAASSGSPTSLWGIFIAGLIGGFAAFLMPCIYPMVPLTTSFFTKQGGSRSKGLRMALIYGLSIIVIYVALGILITLAFGASALNEMASSALFNLAFFVIILIFAVSFLGAFEITLPARFVNKIDQQSDRGGLIGIFFMAFTLALVSFSCTGPIIGYLLVEAVSEGALLGPAIGMLGFSIALALPFIVFAAFPAFLKEMPKSGGWLNTVKVSLGFLELALAFKFLSNVDLAYHWGILDREIFLAIWIVIFALFGLYLLGKLKLSPSDDVSIISLPRLFFAMLILTFTMYMVPGMWGAPLKGISAWLPPQPTQDFDLSRLSYGQLSSPEDREASANKKYAGLFKTPHGLDAFYDYQEGLDYAKKVNKPALIDFTGWSCVNCRKMEATVWADEEVLRRLRNDYVIISLYVDDRTSLDEEEQYISSFSGKKINTIGKKWSDLQSSVFKTNSQPYYVIMNGDGERLAPAQAYNMDIQNYVNFLAEGLKSFENKN